jgi:hypothetical protein
MTNEPIIIHPNKGAVYKLGIGIGSWNAPVGDKIRYVSMRLTDDDICVTINEHEIRYPILSILGDAIKKMDDVKFDGCFCPNCPAVI